MGLTSFFRRFKRRRTTRQTGFRSYHSSKTRNRKRKPFTPKKTKISPTGRQERKSAKKRSKIIGIIKILLFLAVLAGLIYLAFFTKLLEIQKIEVKGDENTLEEQAAINLYLQDYLGDNLILFNDSKHEVELLDQYSYLKNLNIRRTPLHTLVANITTYDHVANIHVEHEDGSKQFFIANELGYIASVGLSDESLPTIVMDVTGTDLDLPESQESLGINQEIIEKENLETLIDAKTRFEGKFDMQILEVHYLKRARELHFLTERYFYVWLDLTQDVDLQLSKLKKAMTQLNIYEEDLEYIDLRISGQNGEKVIYKSSTQTE